MYSSLKHAVDSKQHANNQERRKEDGFEKTGINGNKRISKELKVSEKD